MVVPSQASVSVSLAGSPYGAALAAFSGRSASCCPARSYVPGGVITVRSDLEKAFPKRRVTPPPGTPETRAGRREQPEPTRGALAACLGVKGSVIDGPGRDDGRGRHLDFRALPGDGERLTVARKSAGRHVRLRRLAYRRPKPGFASSVSALMRPRPLVIEPVRPPADALAPVNVRRRRRPGTGCGSPGLMTTGTATALRRSARPRRRWGCSCKFAERGVPGQVTERDRGAVADDIDGPAGIVLVRHRDRAGPPGRRTCRGAEGWLLVLVPPPQAVSRTRQPQAAAGSAMAYFSYACSKRRRQLGEPTSQQRVILTPDVPARCLS